MEIEAASARADGLYWIDDLGHWHKVDPTSPFAHLRDPIAENQQGHAFRWLGMVRAVARGATLHVKWDVRHVEDDSLAAIADYVEQGYHAFYELEFFHGGWNTETFGDPAAAAQRIGRTRIFRDVAFIAPLTVAQLEPHVKQMLREDILREDVPLLDRAVAAWEASKRIWGPERPLYWLADRTLVMQPSRKRANAALVHHVGPEHPMAKVLGPEGTVRQNGKMCDLPWLSEDQGRRLLRAYREVTASGKPHLEDVRSLIAPRGAEPAWVPYRRLLLPCHTEDGTAVVAGISEIRQDISIPFMGQAA